MYISGVSCIFLSLHPFFYKLRHGLADQCNGGLHLKLKHANERTRVGGGG